MTVKEKIRNSYDRYAAVYDSGTGLQRDLAVVLGRLVTKDTPHPCNCLDIGCGTGYIAEELGGRYFYVGCDISSAMLKCAKKKTMANYIQADAARLPFADSSFEIVVSSAAYHWVADLKNAFKEARRALKSNGRFYFTVFNNNTLWQLQSVCKEVNIASSSFPDRAKLSSALAEAGFTVASIETFRYKKYYKDLWELLLVLKKIGSNSANNKTIAAFSWRRILRQANDLYAAKFGSDKGLPAAYEAFLVKAYKNLQI